MNRHRLIVQNRWFCGGVRGFNPNEYQLTYIAHPIMPEHRRSDSAKSLELYGQSFWFWPIVPRGYHVVSQWFRSCCCVDDMSAEPHPLRRLGVVFWWPGTATLAANLIWRRTMDTEDTIEAHNRWYHILVDLNSDFVFIMSLFTREKKMISMLLTPGIIQFNNNISYYYSYQRKTLLTCICVGIVGFRLCVLDVR